MKSKRERTNTKLANTESKPNPVLNLLWGMMAAAAEIAAQRPPFGRKARFGQFVYTTPEGVKQDKSERVNYERTKPKWISAT